MSAMHRIESILVQAENDRCVLFLSNEETIELKSRELPFGTKAGDLVKVEGDELTFYAHSADGAAVIGDFGDALRWLREGRRVARRGWNGKGMWVAMQIPTALSKMTLPYAYMSTAQGDLVPWLASQTDIFASDWEVVDGA